MIERFTLDRPADRLDIFLAEAAGLSRGRVRKIIDIGGVHVAGRRVRRASLPLRTGQQLELHTDNQPLTPFRLSEAEIAFHDDHLLIINKPAGVLTQPSPARYKGTLYEAIQQLLKSEGRRNLHIGMHQRLDAGTTGLLAFSIHQAAHKGLTEQVARRTLRRTYLALVQGCPQERGTIRSQLARRRKDNLTISVDRGGREAITHFTKVDQFNEFALMHINLETGRSHQIRAHFSEAGHPLLGDSRYGGPTTACGLPLNRPCLHSAELCPRHPVNGKSLTFTAPLPADMARLLEAAQ